MAQPDTRTRRPRTSTAFAILGAIVVLGLAVVILARRADPVYSIESYEVTLAITGAIVALLGLAGILVVRRYDQLALTTLAAALIISGLAALFSIGTLLFLTAAIPIWLLMKRMDDGIDRPAILSGAGLAAGLLVLAWVAMQPPLVRCGATAATVDIDGRYESVSGEATSTDDGEVGWVQFDGNRVSYECRNGDLVRFELSAEAG